MNRDTILQVFGAEEDYVFQTLLHILEPYTDDDTLLRLLTVLKPELNDKIVAFEVLNRKYIYFDGKCWDIGTGEESQAESIVESHAIDTQAFIRRVLQ